ncbi:MAG: YdcF family protein, partial [Deltaproteobacteria bacterium]|nr:YdcF family protein [Deltaproteobacteria bacterium]
VVVLGSGHVSDPDLPRTAQIGGSSLYRLVEGIRIYRLLPGSRLVLSGGLTLDPVTNARIVGDVARQIGIPAQDAIVEERPRDTLEEAKVLRGLLGSEPFVLVTSAAHMKRAVGIFKDLGMLPLPAPTDFILKNGPAGSAETWLPNCGNIFISQRVIYEWLGEAWRWIRGIARL